MIERREFITLLSGAAASWPLVAGAQKAALPVIGYLSIRTLKSEGFLVAAFRQGLAAGGFVEGQNIAIDYRFADGHYEQVPTMAADLVQRKVALIFSGGGTALAAKAATRTIPIVFSSNGDPVQSGMVESLARPGGNMTGASNLGGDVTAKRLQLMHDLIPTARTMGFLTNPTIPRGPGFLPSVQAAAARLSIDLHRLEASSERDFETAFAKLAELHADALLIGPDPYFTSRSEQLAGLALDYALEFGFSKAGSDTFSVAQRWAAQGRMSMRNLFVRFVKNESGATAIEYGLIAAGISVAIIAVVQGVGANLNTTFGSVQTALK